MRNAGLQIELRLRGDNKLHMPLVGPDELGELGELEILSIRVDDDDSDRSSLVAGGAEPAELRAHVWGPFRFTPIAFFVAPQRGHLPSELA
jgi:hypothetical protein